ncbi:hypothetical protein IJ818_02340 [bacterium]|nr:hypothetical protein [bacterium]
MKRISLLIFTFLIFSSVPVFCIEKTEADNIHQATEQISENATSNTKETTQNLSDKKQKEKSIKNLPDKSGENSTKKTLTDQTTENNKKNLKKTTKDLKEDSNNNTTDNTEDSEVLHGFVEYYPDGTIFFDRVKESEGIFLQIKQPTTYNQYSVLDIKGVNFEEIKNRQAGVSAKKHISNEYQIVDFNTEYTEKIGKFSYGTSYGADIDTGEFEYNTKFFARYDSKYYAIQAAFGKNAYTSTGTQEDYIYITPEWKLGKGFVLMDTYKTNTLGIKSDNEIVLKYTPQFIKDNPLDIELGVGQSFYQNGEQKNVFKFATTIRL